MIDFRNNVVFNLSGATNLGDAHINFINNYYRPGPNTPRNNHPIASKIGTEDQLKAFLSGNIFEGNPAYTDDNYPRSPSTAGRTGATSVRRSSEFACPANSTWEQHGRRPTPHLTRSSASCKLPVRLAAAMRPTFTWLRAFAIGPAA